MRNGKHTTWATVIFLAAVAAHAFESTPGKVLCNYFDGIPENEIATMVKDPRFPAQPTRTAVLDHFQIPTNQADNFGTLVYGLILPPTTGEYVFWIAGENQSELWLATDSGRPGERCKIAEVKDLTRPCEWDREPGQKSAPVRLEAGKRYYIEARHKEGAGGDNLAVGWTLPGGAEEKPIPGSRLATSPIVNLTWQLPPLSPPPKLINHPALLPSVHGFHKLRTTIEVSGTKVDVPYLIYLPKGYSPQTRDRYPLLTFLHGCGENGSDLEAILNTHGPASDLRRYPKLQDDFPFIVLSPQSTGWRPEQPNIPQVLAALVRQTALDFPVDLDRISLTGLSMGGTGTWHVALADPRLWAALVPCDATMVGSPQQAAAQLGPQHVWIIVGGNDGAFTSGSKEMALYLLLEGKAKVELTIVPGAGHGVWGSYYQKPQFYQWLAGKRRSDLDKPNRPPPSRSGTGMLVFPASGPSVSNTGGKPNMSSTQGSQTGRTTRDLLVDSQTGLGPYGPNAIPIAAVGLALALILMIAALVLLWPPRLPSNSLPVEFRQSA